MTRINSLRHKFVREIPHVLEDGMLYISLSPAVVVHNCCCGCGYETVLPLAPRHWRMIFDGDSVSLHPSIGNRGYPCRSHYWITQNRVEWCQPFSGVVAATDQTRNRPDWMQNISHLLKRLRSLFP